MTGARFMRGVAVSAFLLCTSCAHEVDALYGSYVAHNAAYEEFSPPVTLQLTRPDRYRFCTGGGCSSGRFSIWTDKRANDGRITFHGNSVEDFALNLSRATFGESEVDRQRGKQGLIEVDYRIGMTGAEITLGAGDAAFVKR